jgi:hypothetical protein
VRSFVVTRAKRIKARVAMYALFIVWPPDPAVPRCDQRPPRRRPCRPCLDRGGTAFAAAFEA